MVLVWNHIKPSVTLFFAEVFRERSSEYSHLEQILFSPHCSFPRNLFSIPDSKYFPVAFHSGKKLCINDSAGKLFGIGFTNWLRLAMVYVCLEIEKG